MKRKSNGVRRARLNMRGFEQEEGIHYDPSSTTAPVTNDVTIRMMLTLALMAGWIGYIIDVKGAFLHGQKIRKNISLKMRRIVFITLTC